MGGAIFGRQEKYLRIGLMKENKIFCDTESFHSHLLASRTAADARGEYRDEYLTLNFTGRSAEYFEKSLK